MLLQGIFNWYGNPYLFGKYTLGPKIACLLFLAYLHEQMTQVLRWCESQTQIVLTVTQTNDSRDVEVQKWELWHKQMIHVKGLTLTSSVIVGGVLFAGDQLLGMEKLTVSASANLKRQKG